MRPYLCALLKNMATLQLHIALPYALLNEVLHKNNRFKIKMITGTKKLSENITLHFICIACEILFSQN